MTTRPGRLRAHLVMAARLAETVTPEDGAELEVVPGDSVVLVATRHRPRRFLTYDTGAVETLLVDLGPGFDPNAPPDQITDWRAIGFSIAGMRPSYLARAASGVITLAKSAEHAWFGARARLQIVARLTFTSPQYDPAGLGAVDIDWRLTTPNRLLPLNA